MRYDFNLFIMTDSTFWNSQKAKKRIFCKEKNIKKNLILFFCSWRKEKKVREELKNIGKVFFKSLENFSSLTFWSFRGTYIRIKFARQKEGEESEKKMHMRLESYHVWFSHWKVSSLLFSHFLHITIECGKHRIYLRYCKVTVKRATNEKFPHFFFAPLIKAFTLYGWIEFIITSTCECVKFILSFYVRNERENRMSISALILST